MKKEFLINWVRKVLLNENDVMASYRTRIIPPVGTVALVLLTIFERGYFRAARRPIG